MKPRIVIVLSFILLISPAFSFAQQQTSFDNLAILVQQLQEQIRQLQEQIDSLQTELSSTKTEVVQLRAELRIERTLRRGMRGEDIEQLQKFLSQYPDIYPEGIITGFFGSLTERAVQRWQEKEGIVNFGSPETTGYGQVGTRTRAALNSLVTEGAGQSGNIPSGLTKAPGLQESTSDSTLANTSTSTQNETLEETIPATPAVPAEPIGQTSTTTAPATPAVPAEPAEPISISNIEATNIGGDSVTVKWHIKKELNSWVEHGLDQQSLDDFASSTALNQGSYYTYSSQVASLNPGTQYWFKVKAVLDNKSIIESDYISFVTAGGAGGSGNVPSGNPDPTSLWTNIQITDSTGEYPAITSDGSGYGVAYGWNGKLYFAKLDSGGLRTQPDVEIATAPDYIFWPNIVWDGSKYGIVWAEANPTNIRFATVDVDGNVLSNIAITAGTDNASTERPVLLLAGNYYVVIWSGGWPDSYNNCCDKIVYLTKIASDGKTVVIDRKKSITSGNAQVANGPIVSATWNGTSFGIVWQDIRDTGDSNEPRLYFNTLNSGGDKIGSDTKISTIRRVGSPNIFSDGSGFSIFWREGTNDDVNANSIYFTKVDASGTKLITNINLNTKSDNEVRVSVAQTGNAYGISWYSAQNSAIYFKETSLAGNITTDNELISTAVGSNDYPIITWNESRYGVIWHNVENNQASLYFGSK